MASGTPVTAVPNTGYSFVSWSDGGLTATRTDANVTANLSVTATFAINTYTITPSAGANGSISPNAAQTVNYGAEQAFTITPATGYHVADVLVDGSSVGAVTSYTFSNVTTAHAISATFAINTYTITPSAGRQRHHQPQHAADRRPRRRPDLHHHAGDGLLRRRRPRRRRLGRPGDQLHLHGRLGEPHHQRHVRSGYSDETVDQRGGDHGGLWELHAAERRALRFRRSSPRGGHGRPAGHRAIRLIRHGTVGGPGDADDELRRRLRGHVHVDRHTHGPELLQAALHGRRRLGLRWLDQLRGAGERAADSGHTQGAVVGEGGTVV